MSAIRVSELKETRLLTTNGGQDVRAPFAPNPHLVAVYSNRVAVVDEQPVNTKMPIGL